jgi:hypothetical protein
MKEYAKTFLFWISTFVFVLLLCLLFSSCSHKIYDSLEWQAAKVTADGKIPEWSNPLRFYDDKSKINYTVANDRQNLYVCMKISDETSQIKILRGGMEFKIDTSGKKVFPITFIFPIANQQMIQRKKNENQPEKNSGEKPDRSAIKQKLVSQAVDVQLIGFKPPLGGILPLYNTSSGISAGINIDNMGIMYYEAIIPFNTFYKNELSAADTNKVFNYEIKVNAPPAPPMHQGSESGGRGMGGGGMGGGGMRGGGGMGGMGGGGGMRGGHGGGGGNSSGNSEMYVTNKVNIKMKFSFK